MEKNTRNGLFALGLAAVAAWYKMSPEKKSNIKSKLTDLGNKLKENLPKDLKNMTNRQKTTPSS